jgi:opacity protein-like surface antigen
MGTFAYNTGYYKSTTRFYVLGGLGLTRYGNVTLKTIDGKDAQIGGRGKFATTWGAGVKYRVNPMVGLKGQIRYTPTNIKDTADDWLCSPYWPATCTAGGVNHQFASQLEFSVGALLRF